MRKRRSKQRKTLKSLPENFLKKGDIMDMAIKIITALGFIAMVAAMFVGEALVAANAVSELLLRF